jgi:hypothetical protein
MSTYIRNAIIIAVFLCSVPVPASSAATPIPIEQNHLVVSASNYKSLNEAVKASSGKTVTITEPINLTDTLVVPKDVGITVRRGGSIQKTNQYMLTINGPFVAGLFQVFHGFAAGDVTFGQSSIKAAYPQWWGAQCDGVVDDTIPLQNAIHTLRTGAEVSSPKCTFKITDTIDFTSIGEGYSIKDIDLGGSDIHWHGGESRPMFKLFNNKNLSIRNFRLYGRNVRGVIGIFMDSKQPEFMFDIVIDKIRIEDCDIGVQLGDRTKSVNANVSNMRISNFSIARCNTGMLFESVNADLNIFETGTLAANDIDINLHHTGVAEFRSVNGYGAKKDGGINTMFYISGAFDSIRIVNCQKEGSQKPLYFLKRLSYAGTGSEGPLSIVDSFADADILFDGEGSAGGQIVNFMGGYTRNITVNVSDLKLNFFGTYGKAGASITVNAPSGVVLTNFSSKIDSILNIKYPTNNEYLLYSNLSKFRGIQGSPGHLILPDNTIMQWGRTNEVTVKPGETYNFVLSFNPVYSNVFTFVPSGASSSSSSSGIKAWTQKLTNTSATVRVESSSKTAQPISVTWWAIGK